MSSGHIPEFPDFSQMDEFGVTGSRHGSEGQQYLALKFMIEYLHESGLYIMHHGKAKGVDAEAHWIAKRLRAAGMKVVIHPPDNARWRDDTLPVESSWIRELPPAGYHERDRQIAMASAVLVAVPEFPELDERSKRSGTWLTVRYARRYARQVYWCDKDGSIHDATEAPHGSA